MKVFLLMLMMGIGAFSICSSVMNWDFFFNSYKAQVLVRFLGRNGARVFYAVLGAFIVVLGVMALISGDL